MSPFDPTVDTTFREYAELQLRRHTLLIEGKEKDPEFDQIEDRMTELWETLDATQRQSLNGMGSDLNWIRRKGQPPPKGRKAEEVNPTELQELLAAQTRMQWRAFLHYLRLCAPTIPAANLAYLRGTTYDALGLSAYASGFYELAADLEPANASMGVIAMRAVDRADPAKALRRAEQVVASSVRFPPAVAAMSAVMVLRGDQAANRPIDKERYVGVLNDAIRRLQLEPPSDAGQAMVYQLAASGFEIIDDLAAALRCYEEGLKRAPDNEVLLVGKGLLLYGSRTDQAVEALNRVAQKGTPLVWPYFFLAHHFVLRREYDTALRMVRKAWERAAADPVRAELLQWQAICLNELGIAPEAVGTLLEKAASLDPSNRRIRKNLEALEEAMSAQRGANWDVEEEEALRVEWAPRMSELEPLAVA